MNPHTVFLTIVNYPRSNTEILRSDYHLCRGASFVRGVRSSSLDDSSHQDSVSSVSCHGVVTVPGGVNLIMTRAVTNRMGIGMKKRDIRENTGITAPKMPIAAVCNSLAAPNNSVRFLEVLPR